MYPGTRSVVRRSFSSQPSRSISTPSNDRSCQTLLLPDGRTLGYAEYGSPNGTPVFYFPGVPDSRIAIATSSEMAKKLNIRFIGVDRPGIGLSSFYSNRKVLDWPADLQHLVEQLPIDKYRILSVSGGTGYALACAKVLPREKLRSVGVMVGVGPWECGTRGMSLANRIGLNLWAYAPTRSMMRAIYNYWVVPVAHDPDPSKLENSMRNQLKYFKESDLRVLNKPGEFELLVDVFREVWRQGIDGQVERERLVTSHWGFELEEVEYDKIRLWYGSDDVNTPPRMGEYMAERLPHATLRVFPGQSHFTMWEHAEEILTELLEDD